MRDSDTGNARFDRVMWHRRVAATILLSLIVAAVAAEALAAPTVKSVRIGEQSGMTRLVLDISESASFTIFTLAEPERVVIDMPPALWAPAERTLPIARAGVTQLRFGHFTTEVSRIVLDLSRPLALQQARLLPPGRAGAATHRLVLDFVPVSPEAFRASVKSAEPAAKAATAARPAGPTREARLSDPAEAVPQPRPKPLRHLIALDAGHGGRDPGAISSSGVREKDVVLTFARELRRALLDSGRYRVVMTRNSDRKVGLHRRVEIAREAGAALFLSIHVDRLEDGTVRGASVYTLSDESSDAETAALAARENKADVVADVDLSEGYDEEVAKVLISLVQQNTMNCSAAFAALLLPELGRVAPLIRRAHRFGDFRVLKAPDIPSVLIELGFLSNDRDAERLRSRSHRAALAGAIIEAIDRHFREPC